MIDLAVTLLWLAGLMLALAALLAARWLSAVAAAGAGYKAKVAASALFVSGLALDLDSAPELNAESYRALRLFRAKADGRRRSVRAKLPGFRARTAVFRAGAGATLADGEPAALSVPPASGKSCEFPRAAASRALSAVLDSAFTEPNARGLRRTRAVLVLQDGHLLGERYAAGFGPDTALNGWSMAKAALGALVGVAVGEGKLALSQSSLLPQWSAPGDPRAAIKVEDLLRMRSGLRFSERYSDLASDVVRMLFVQPDAGGFAASKALAAAPGSHWQYSSGSTNILSLALRRAYGEEAYHALPRRALFDPLGMGTAIFEADASGTFVGSSFLFASARDWARFGQLHLQGGVWEGRRLLPEGWTTFISTPTPQAPDGCYGAHWWLKLQKELGGGGAEAARIPPGTLHALGHEGQCLTIVPERGLVIVRLGLSIRIEAWNHASFVAAVLDAV